VSQLVSMSMRVPGGAVERVVAVVRINENSGVDAQAKMIENAPCKMMLKSQRVVLLPLRYSVMPPPQQRPDRRWALHERDRDCRI
jgi:hypothetical protein